MSSEVIFEVAVDWDRPQDVVQIVTYGVGTHRIVNYASRKSNASAYTDHVPQNYNESEENAHTP